MSSNTTIFQVNKSKKKDLLCCSQKSWSFKSEPWCQVKLPSMSCWLEICERLQKKNRLFYRIVTLGCLPQLNGVILFRRQCTLGYMTQRNQVDTEIQTPS